jgi:hypothetical protein
VAERVAPGLYLTPDNTLHLDVVELLEHFGYADTPANRDTVVDVAREVLARQYPGVPQSVV